MLQETAPKLGRLILLLIPRVGLKTILDKCGLGLDIEELTASHVELRPANRTGGMKRCHFSAQEIISSGDVGWDLDVHSAATCIQILRPPVIVIPGLCARSLWCSSISDVRANSLTGLTLPATMNPERS